MHIQFLNPDDRNQWQILWNGYLEFYKSELPDDITNLTWNRLHDPLEPMYAFGAYENGKLIGFAHVLLQRSTWAKNGYAYLEDLFVDPNIRGKGTGSELIKAVYDFADEKQLDRVYWATQADNPARRLYDKYANESGFVQYRRK
ncbi:GNAT family N-acetyltransferase [Hirschia maritima]|uniref:GNAT family N-acetyltransferase n=1 Tax=Hirschia maritima TaxID=1121961 RepID=UPI00037328C0|nr:GNAT family N-acetyltransferase [Hirschia maritima]